MIHRPRVVSNGKDKAIATCSCKWVGPARDNVAEARIDANAHEYDAIMDGKQLVSKK